MTAQKRSPHQRRWGLEVSDISLDLHRFLAEIEELPQTLGRKLGDEALARLDDRFRELLLALRELVHPFFDGAGADELVDCDRSLLADAERPVRRLVVHRGVPPPIVVEDVPG